MTENRKHYLLAGAIAIAAASFATMLCSPAMRGSLIGDFLWQAELATYDFRLANSTLNTLSDRIVFVAIDEESINQLGVWPWSRKFHAKVIENLAAAGATFVGLDIVMTTVSNAEISPEAAPDKPLDWEPPLSDADRAMVAALNSAGNVVMAVNLARSKVQGEDLQGQLMQPQFPHWRFEKAAYRLGVIVAPRDIDGEVRRCPLTRKHQDKKYYTMPLVLAAAHRGVPPQKMIGHVNEATGVGGGHDSDGTLIAYRGPPSEGIRRIPYYQVLRRGSKNTEWLKKLVEGKVVIVGAAAEALQDTYDTPVSAAPQAGDTGELGQPMPGAEIMANATDAMLADRYIYRTSAHVTWLVCGLLAILTAICTVRLRPLLALIAACLPFTFAVLIGTFALWQYFTIWFPVVSNALAIALSYTGTTVYMELTTERERRRLRQSWSRRVAPEVLEVILSTPALTEVKGKRIEATVLFTDLQGFTSFCHESPPEEVVEILNDHLAIVTRVIRTHGGTLHKFIGDGVMAVFGDPVDQPDHALRTVKAACEMQQQMAELRKGLDEDDWTPYLRVGIHTGELVAGDIGSGEMLEYTVIGDTVSTASRLEGLNKEYRTQIMISAATYHAADGKFDAEALGSAQIRGRAEQLQVFAVEPSTQFKQETVKQ